MKYFHPVTLALHPARMSQAGPQ